MNEFDQIFYSKKSIFVKSILFVMASISYICYKVVKSTAFDGIILLVILWNSLYLATQDTESSNEVSTIDIIFLTIYTIEMILKILAFGFVLNKDSYLRDSWNVLDFVVVVTAYLPVLFPDYEALNF